MHCSNVASFIRQTNIQTWKKSFICCFCDISCKIKSLFDSLCHQTWQSITVVWYFKGCSYWQSWWSITDSNSKKWLWTRSSREGRLEKGWTVCCSLFGLTTMCCFHTRVAVDPVWMLTKKRKKFTTLTKSWGKSTLLMWMWLYYFLTIV